MSDYLDPDNEELLRDFYVEAEMQIETLESNILVLENDPSNSDAIDEVFRAAHTLKGGAATVQMNELASFTHIVEDVLDEIRSGSVEMSSDGTDVLLRAIDVVKAMLESRREGAVFDEDISSIEDALHRIAKHASPQRSDPRPEAPTPAPESSSSPPSEKNGLTEYELLELQEATPPGTSLYEVCVGFIEDNPMNSVGGIQVFAILKGLGKVLKTVPEFDELYADHFHARVQYYVASQDALEGYQSSAEDRRCCKLGGYSTL